MFIGQNDSFQPAGVNGHAETTIINHAAADNIKMHSIAASRLICANCAAALQSAGIIPASPLKAVRDATSVK